VWDIHEKLESKESRMIQMPRRHCGRRRKREREGVGCTLQKRFLQGAKPLQ
jgi:hypothetical protein